MEEKRVENIESFVFYSIITYLLFRGLRGLIGDGIIENNIFFVPWGVGTLLLAILLGLSFGMALGYLLKIIMNPIDKLVPFLINNKKLILNILAIIFFIIIFIAYSENNYQFWLLYIPALITTFWRLNK